MCQVFGSWNIDVYFTCGFGLDIVIQDLKLGSRCMYKPVRLGPFAHVTVWAVRATQHRSPPPPTGPLPALCDATNYSSGMCCACDVHSRSGLTRLDGVA